RRQIDVQAIEAVRERIAVAEAHVAQGDLAAQRRDLAAAAVRLLILLRVELRQRVDRIARGGYRRQAAENAADRTGDDAVIAHQDGELADGDRFDGPGPAAPAGRDRAGNGQPHAQAEHGHVEEG